LAETSGTTPARELLSLLEREAPRFSFFQSLLLLERLFKKAPRLGAEGPASQEPVRIRPSMALSCPPADLESVEVSGEGARVEITTTFLGLYGVDGPLPNAYLEHIAAIADEPGGRRVRDFLDLFHHRLYSLLYRAWKKPRPTAGEEGLDPLHDRALAPAGFSNLLGLGGARRPRLAEARLRVLRPRTAHGLEALLRQRLGYDCPVDSLRARWAVVPDDQRCRLGTQNAELGCSLLVGARANDRNKIQVRVAASSYAMFENLMPEGSDRRELDDALGGYLRDPIDYDVQVTLPAEQVPPWRLGYRGRVARNVWLGVPRPEAVCRWRGQPQI
jgi:type VI secretion system protein ImpH